MKIIYLANLALPKIAEIENIQKSNFGGWLVKTVEKISTNDSTQLLYIFANEKGYLEGKTDIYKYIGFKNELGECQYDESLTKTFEHILADFSPNVIHIWGTEYPHSLSMIKACDRLNLLDKTVISIQGLCSEIEKAYYAGISEDFCKRKTFRELIRGGNLMEQRENFYRKGQNEIECLKIAKNVIGRTLWDKTCSLKINPNLKYHFCNETLRDSFYLGDKWEYAKCNKHSIFVSQASYPIKGFHILLSIAGQLKNRYKDFKIYVTGKDFIAHNFHDYIRMGTYQKYVAKLIKKNKLQKNIVYLGSLNEKEMKESYRRTNVFTSLSSIENSPSSVGEAMILGVPIVCSNVGGCSSMLNDNIEGLMYDFNDTEKLLNNIIYLFENPKDAEKMCENAMERAKNTHNLDYNINNLISIYNNL